MTYALNATAFFFLQVIICFRAVVCVVAVFCIILSSTTLIVMSRV